MDITKKIFEIAYEQQMSMAEMSRQTGIPVPTLSSWKTRNTAPPADKLYSIAECLGVEVTDLLGIEKNCDTCEKDVCCQRIITDANGNCYAENRLNNGKVTRFPVESYSSVLPADIQEVYSGLSSRDKLAVQMFILDTAEGEKKK